MIKTNDELRDFFGGDEPISHPTDALLNDWIARIRSGERGSAIDGIAREIIRDFYLRNFLGVPQSAVSVSWLAEALSEILDHRDPLDALGLQRRQNKRPPDPGKSMDVAMWVACAEELGLTRPAAIAQAAETFATDDSNVRKLLKKSEPLEWMNPNRTALAEYFQHRGKPLPRSAGNK